LKIGNYLLAACAAAWAALLVAAYVFLGSGLWGTVPRIWADAAKRAEIESGDADYHRFLAGVTPLKPGEGMLILGWDPTGQGTFLQYRACYALYPGRPFYVPMGNIPFNGRRLSLSADPALAGLVRERGMTEAAVFHRPVPALGGMFKLKVDRAGKLELARAPAGTVQAAPPAPARPVLWVAGVASLLALGFALSLLAGIDGALGRDLPARLGFSFFAGAGVTAWLMLVLGLARVKLGLPVILAVWLVPLAAARAMLHLRKRDAASPALPGGIAPEVPAGLPAWEKAGIGLLAFAGAWSVLTVAIPMSAWSNWDTWAIWNFKARACLLERGIPFAMLAEPLFKYSHPDYPLGLPMVQTYLAMWSGGMDERLLRALSPFYLLSLASLLALLFRELGAGRFRWLLTGLFITVPKVVEQASSGYADLPVACGMTACLLMLALAWRGAGVGWAAGLAGGLAAIHKDEGLIWAGSAVLLLALWAWRGRGAWKQAVVAIALVAALAAPWKAVTASMGLRPNDYSMNLPRLAGLLPARLPMVAWGVALETLGPGVTMQALLGEAAGAPGEMLAHLRGTWLALWYAVGLAALLGFRRWLDSPLLRWLALVPFLQACAYTAVYAASVVEPQPLRGAAWHITTSLDRLLLQLAPAAFVLAAAACLAAASPSVAETRPPAKQHGQQKKGKGS